MADLTLSDIPPRLLVELREWAALRRSTVEAAAVEMIRIGLYQTRERGTADLPDGLDITDDATRH